MQPSPQSSSAAKPASFAGLLASLAMPARKPSPAWSEDDLAGDVATLSYESALRAHARYKPSSEPYAMPSEVPLSPAPAARESAKPPIEPSAAPAADNSLKCASITIRMSAAECAQLRRRAAEAGMTVSAYLRSCTFEAEALRAQVKQALAELRAATAPAEPQREFAQPQAFEPRNWRARLQRILPHTQPLQQPARA
jgi:hypothetical protein